jgi:hypothetical protein
MVDEKPFIPYAKASNMAWQIINQLVIEDRDHIHRERLLLWKAYIKRIKPVPDEILADAVTAFRQAMAWAKVEPADANEAQLVMDMLGDLCWAAINESARREWLLKAV